MCKFKDLFSVYKCYFLWCNLHILSLCIFFLLVQFQQAEAIRERTGYEVGHYCGEMGQDFWDTRRWQREFDTKQVGLTVFVIRTCSLLLFSCSEHFHS